LNLKEIRMSASFGPLKLDPVCVAQKLAGIGRHSTPWQVVAAFVKEGEGRAERLVENRKGILILLSIPDRPNTGGIYLYSYQTRSFYMLRFDREDDFSAAEFEAIFQEYNLEQYILRGLPFEFRNLRRRAARHRPRHNWHRGNRSNQPTPSGPPNAGRAQVLSQ
jgi:hypothetical protein